MLLLPYEQLDGRRRAAAGGLAPLAASLAADLERLTSIGEPHLPVDKAKLTRDGGRCPVHGTPLEFDPWAPREHRCAACGTAYIGEAHDRWWIMGYQLWLAERAVHAALLHLLLGDPRHAALADRILERYAEHYLTYPNRDNVLGPSRPFFSTYLESIWLLQLSVALDLREHGGLRPALAARVRDRVIEPSAALIASYDEGMSNRQAWNNAALIAAHLVLGRPDGARRQALDAPSGLCAHLTRAVLPDGTWYEGENYHLFAHRGLWYGVVLADRAGVVLPDEALRRFDAGFAAPFLTTLPDFTFPARRDSQFGVSLRQWRFAELAELGLARGDDPRLTGALWELYRDVPELRGRPTGRDRSTAEAERNVPAARLGRADLGWRSLLRAREALARLAPTAPASILMQGQGLAVLRRDAGRIFVALDYGVSGGGHGHPDRLNLLIADGATRWLDDAGTGSYVDRSLHWYRSTLAHNAPLFDGRSQERIDGRLIAWEERDGCGWVQAAVDGLAARAHGTRAVVVMDDYVVDDFSWLAPDDAVVDLPLHVAGEVTGEGLGAWRPAVPEGGDGPEDGFGFLTGTMVATLGDEGPVRIAAGTGAGGPALAGWLFPGKGAELWRGTAPGPPVPAGDSSGTVSRPRQFLFVRRRGGLGTISMVWSLRGRVADVTAAGATLRVTRSNGVWHEHHRHEAGWTIDITDPAGTREIMLAGLTARQPSGAAGAPGGSGQADPAAASGASEPAPRPHVPAVIPVRLPHITPVDGIVRRTIERVKEAAAGHPDAIRFELGEPHYRRSEVSWAEAGRPRATVALYVEFDALVAEVHVHKSPPVFAPRRERNELDNEHPDINSDGLQLYVATPAGRACGWLMVPEEGGGDVRVTPVAGLNCQTQMRARWSPMPEGWRIKCPIPIAQLGLTPGTPFLLDLIVNEIVAPRERRRGQLVLSGGTGEYAYLQGDRHPVSSFLPFVIEHV